MSSNDNNKSYWKENLKLIAVCLVIWFTVSFGFGIFLVEQLNEFNFGGFKLGFWFAQQGAIYSFLILIFFYIYRMNQLDKKYQVND